MNHIIQMLSKLLNVAKEAIDHEGLIAILTTIVGNEDELDQSEESIKVYNTLINQLDLDILKDVDYRSNIYTYFGIEKKPNDTILMDMMIKLFHIKRFDSELFIFNDKGWQKVNEDELRDIVSKMIQVLLVGYKPSLSTLKNVVNGIQKSTDVD